MQKLMLLNREAPGDIVMLTAALRDLHRCYPDQFVTDIRTHCMEVWQNNPYLTPLDITDRDVKILDCHYPLYKESNHRPFHFIQGFVEDLNNQLGLQIKITEFRGDIHLSAEEKSRPSPVEELTGEQRPYWIIVAGGKFDITIKWWHIRRWQTVVDHFRDRIRFVQVGLKEHYHPGLKDVLDLRGRTGLRELIRLIYHADGVLCPLTLVMHLAAAVETKPSSPKARPCVVVAGAREAPHWAAYPTHQFLHTVGALPCCADGGCWKVRTVPLGDGDERDHQEHLCVDVVNGLPRCMDMISPQDVIRSVELYLHQRLRAQFEASNHTQPPGGTSELPMTMKPQHDGLILNLRASKLALRRNQAQCPTSSPNNEERNAYDGKHSNQQSQNHPASR